MYRYVAYYHYDCSPKMKADDIDEINEIFEKNENFNPMINQVFHECVSSRKWADVPLSMDKKIKGWNWKLKDTQKGYVEVLSEEQLTENELWIMADETEGQISDGYNENGFVFRLSNGHRYSIYFHTYPITDFKEE